jgi:haloalkane dehalogenase
MIGMGYATRYPNQISRLIIMNTAAFLLPAKLKLPWQLIVGRSFLAPLLIKGFNTFCRGAVKSCVTRKAMDAQTANAYLAPYDNWGNRHAVFRFVQDIPMKPGDESYETVAEITNKLEQFKNLPVLILWGIQDFVFNEGFLDEWLKYLPHADVHRIENAGHYVLEDAHDEIIPLVLKYLGDKQDVANC